MDRHEMLMDVGTKVAEFLNAHFPQLDDDQLMQDITCDLVDALETEQ